MTAIPQELAKLERIRVQLAECTSLSEVRQIRDIARAAEVYAKASHMSREMVNRAGEMKLLADRKAGELLKQLQKSQGGRPEKTVRGVRTVSDYHRVLEETNTSKDAAARWQKIADIPETAFREYLTAVEASDDEEISTAGLLKAANGSPRQSSRPTSSSDPEAEPFNEEVVLTMMARRIDMVIAALWPSEQSFEPVVQWLRGRADYLESMGPNRNHK